MTSQGTEDQAANLAKMMKKGLSITVSRESWTRSVEGFKNAAVIKLVTGDYFNVNALANILKKAWAVENKDVVFEEILGNMAVVKFRKQSKLDEILSNGPWTFQNQIICVKKWIIGVKPEALEFDRLHIWVQLHNIPQEYMGDEVTEEIASRLGTIIKRPAEENGVKKRKFARYMIEFNVNNEVPEGALINLAGGEMEPFWVTFKFERLQLLCTKCKVIKHKTSNCPLDDEVQGKNIMQVMSSEFLGSMPEQPETAVETGEKTQRSETEFQDFRRQNVSGLKNEILAPVDETLRLELVEMEKDTWIENKKRKGKDKIQQNKRLATLSAPKEQNHRFHPYKGGCESKLTIGNAIDGFSQTERSAEAGNQPCRDQ